MFIGPFHYSVLVAVIPDEVLPFIADLNVAEANMKPVRYYGPSLPRKHL
jgi:hypothetical protein